MGKIVKVHNVNKQDTPLFINGHGVTVPHNVDFPLADNFVDLLTQSNINFTIQGDVPDAECAGFISLEGAEAGAGDSDASAPETAPDEAMLPEDDQPVADDAPVEAPLEAPLDEPVEEQLTPPEPVSDDQPVVDHLTLTPPAE